MGIDVVELEEIRNKARCDKRHGIYQLWFGNQPGVTRRQLPTALRAKHVGENTIEEQELTHMVILSKH